MQDLFFDIVRNVRESLVIHVKNGWNTREVDFHLSENLACSCAFASFASATVAEHLSLNLKIVNGTFNNSCHVWNHYGNFYYDATVIQFGEEYNGKYKFSTKTTSFKRNNRLPVTAERLKKSNWPISQLPDGSPFLFTLVVEEVLSNLSEIKLNKDLVNKNFTLKKSFI